MSDLQSLNPKTSALVLMDFQNFILKNFVPETGADAVKHAATLLATARAAGMLVIHVTLAFRPGYPEINPRNKLFSRLKENGMAVQGSDGTAIDAALTPRDTEPVVAKHRVGAFTGTDLERLLRANDIETLVLAGVATSGVVLSTVRQAFDLDYAFVVARDACADSDSEMHRVLLDKIFARYGMVVSTAEIEAALRS